MSLLPARPARAFRSFLLALVARLCVSWVAAAMLFACVVGFCAVLLTVTVLAALYGLTAFVMFDWMFSHGLLLPSLLLGTPLDGFAPVIRHCVLALLLAFFALYATLCGLRALQSLAGTTFGRMQ